MRQLVNWIRSKRSEWRRRLSLLLLITILCNAAVMLSACGQKEASATDLMALLLAELDHPEMQLYFDSAPAESEGWLADEKLAALYGDHSPSSLADRYAIALCKDDRMYEIHIYYALNATAASQLEELLRGRLETLQQKENYLYDPDSVAESGIVWRKGRWVCLLVTEDNAAAKKCLKARI